MTVASIPIREIDGVSSNKTLMVEHNSHLQICSHKDQTLVTLHFLGKAITVEATSLQAAIHDCFQGRWDDRATMAVRV